MDLSETITHYPGLSQEQAQKNLKTDGCNELPTQKQQSSLSILWHVLSEPMLLLLVGSGALYLFMGEPRDALMLLSFVFVVIGITFYQENKTEKTLEALKNLSSPRALVIRNGKQRRIAGRDVVRDDIVIVREGDRIPADAIVLDCENLIVDESLLTGESVPVRKSSWDSKQEKQRPGGDDLPFVYSGAMVVNGQGIAKVFATGLTTEIGKIGKSLETIKDEKTLLHKETAKLVQKVATVSIVLCALVVLVYFLVRGSLAQGFLAGLTLSMALLPEEFPVILLIFLTLGAWRISKQKVLTRRSETIETLGAATVLCTDKTGTLTLNKMELTSLYVPDSVCDLDCIATKALPEAYHSLLETGMLASQQDPFDPIEKELNLKGSIYLKHSRHLHHNWKLVKEYSLSKKLLALSHAWQSPNKKDLAIAAKGAPEAILSLCHMDAKQKAKILDQVLAMSANGLRVLAAAKATFTKDKLPQNQHDFNFQFVGLFGFIDPVRKKTVKAVQEAYGAGMRVIVITGDYPGTAQFIAQKIGIKNPDQYLTGEDLEKMEQKELREKIKTVNIFARVVPEQKLLLVEALKANKEIVAMTGDGVNDAPALKAAHIGIAMGQRGTDVAREASALVLLNDDFSSIVTAVRLGRRIYDNIKRAMGYILAVHIPIAGMSLLPLIFDFPVVLLPAHIAFLELIIDPACSTVFESERADPDIMMRPPRNLNQPMFSLKTISINLLQGVGVLVTTFGLFMLVMVLGKGELEARSFAFTALVLANLLLITINLSWNKTTLQILLSANKTLLAVITGALVCLGVVLYIPFFSSLFHVTPLHFNDLLLVALVVVISLTWFELLKFWKSRKILALQKNSNIT